jgi:hypothetical protein
VFEILAHEGSDRQQLRSTHLSRKGAKAQTRKGAKKILETPQRFAPLRLCVRNLLDIA